ADVTTDSGAKTTKPVITNNTSTQNTGTSNTGAKSPIMAPNVCATSNYLVYTSTGASLVPGTVDTGNHCDDCLTSIALPFAYTLYDQTFSTAQVSSNGQLDFGTGNSSYSNVCLPEATAPYD